MKSPKNGVAYAKNKRSITEYEYENPKKISSTSTFGFSPSHQQPFFEASFYGQRPPPSACIYQQVKYYHCSCKNANNVNLYVLPYEKL